VACNADAMQRYKVLTNNTIIAHLHNLLVSGDSGTRGFNNIHGLGQEPDQTKQHPLPLSQSTIISG